MVLQKNWNQPTHFLQLWMKLNFRWLLHLPWIQLVTLLLYWHHVYNEGLKWRSTSVKKTTVLPFGSDLIYKTEYIWFAQNVNYRLYIYIIIYITSILHPPCCLHSLLLLLSVKTPHNYGPSCVIIKYEVLFTELVPQQEILGCHQPHKIWQI